MRVSINPDGFPAANDSIVVNSVTNGNGNSPIAPTTIIMPTDASAVSVDVAISANFTGSYQLIFGTAGNSATLGLPISPTSYIISVVAPATPGTSNHPNYGSLAGIEAIIGQSEVIYASNNEADGSTENVNRILLALNFADSKIDGFFSKIFRIPLIDINGNLPAMVIDWANTIAYRHLLEPKMPSMTINTKGRFVDPTIRIYNEMKMVKARQLELNLVRTGTLNDPVMRSGPGCFGGRSKSCW